ncbi:EAL domain-containing protein [Rhodoferax sp.]|uniref:EAL domain-containing protein n=1 Tax=Rhodoferax sp. TaxID=50421 RepID=UPI002617A536|nr:EAL domain-containing protein [Rhodoferax sp.]
MSLINQTATDLSTKDASVARSLTWRYAIALALVASLSSAAWLSLHWVITEQKSTAAVVNISGRQRMLSQRTALFSNLLVSAAPPERPLIRDSLAEAIELMARSHQGLTQGDVGLGLPYTMTPAERALYFEGAQPLDAQVRTYIDAVRRLLRAADNDLAAGTPELAFITRTATGPLVSALDAMVRLYQQEGEATVARLEKAETLFWLVTLLLLMLEAALIFHPFTKHVNNVIGKLQHATRQLQRHQDHLEELVIQRTEDLNLRTIALTDSEEKFRLISTAAQDAIVIIGPHDELVYWNPAAEHMFGYAFNELDGITFHSLLVPPEHRDAAEIGLKRFKSNGEGPLMGKRFEAVALKKDAEAFPIELSVSAVMLEAGWHGIAIIRDITQRKRIDAELRIAATAFNAQMGMTITDANNIILRVNKAFSDITGYSAEEVIGKTPHLLSSGRHDDAFYKAMFATIVDTGMWAGEIWNRHKNGEVFPEWLTITAVKSDEGVVTHYVAAFSDISERKAAESQIRNLAFYDPLTNLPNRRLLMDRLELAMIAGERRQHVNALFFIDLDNFKAINDTLGHHMGDQLLQQVAQRLNACVRNGDTVARLGGDEFVVMLENLSDNTTDAAIQAELVGCKILSSLQEPYPIAAHVCRATASIGVALFADQSVSVDDLLKRADMSMYQAKASGRNTLRFFDPQVQAAVQAKAELEVSLREAIEQHQFCLYYQPQVTANGQITGAEALVRWLHPVRGMVSPADFIPLAEQTGLILPLGAWVMRTACEQLAQWGQSALQSHWVLAVNVSALQFRHPDFVEHVVDTLTRTGANPQRLKLELTESLLLDDVGDIIAKMTALKATGVSFSLDDFGTGYSSLAYLSRLPLDQLKIDQGFVKDIETSENAVVICAATISLAHSLGLKVVAEGVETLAQLHLLSTVHNCDFIQGYLFSRPLPVADFEAFALGR